MRIKGVRHALRLKIAVGSMLVLSLGGCFESPSEDTGPDPNPIETNLTDPFAMIQSFEKAFNTRNFEAYAAFLDSELTNCTVTQEPPNFPWLTDDCPWLTGGCWNRAAELMTIASLSEPNYAGPGHPIWGTECEITAYWQRIYSENQVVLLGQVHALRMDGSSFDSSVTFTLARRDGFWRIWKIGG